MASSSIYGAQAPIQMCKMHNDQEIEMYCYDCRTPICLECGKTPEHLDHNWVTIARASRQVRTELRDKYADVRNTELKKIQDRLRVYEDAKNENREMIEKIKEQGDVILAAVREVMGNQIAQCNYNLERLQKGFETEKLKKFSANISTQMKALEEDGGSMSNLGLINIHNGLDDLLSDLASLKIEETSLDIFLKGQPNYANLKKMFGNFVPKDEYEVRKPVVSKVSSFTHGKDQISHIVPIDIDRAWVNCIRSKKIELIDTQDKVHDSKDFPELFNGFTGQENGDLLFSLGRKVVKLSAANGFTELASTPQLIPVGVCQSLDGGLFVTLIDAASFDIDENSKRVLRHYSIAGELLMTYEFEDDGTTRLFTRPRRVGQNFNTDICVLDLSSNKEGRLCILAAKGGVKCVYTGTESSEPFCPSAVAFDVCCNILCSDVYNHTIHYLNPAGQFLRYLLTSENCVERPTAMALFNNALFVGGNTGQIRVYSYRV